MSNGTSNYENLFNPTTLTSGGAAGVFTVDSVNSGTARGSTNSQQQAFQFGVDTNGVTDPYVAHTRILAPFAGITPQGSQSMGLFVGTGDQNNYVQILVTANNGSPAIQVGYEVNGVFTLGATTLLTWPLTGSIDLYLSIDPNSNTVQPGYAITSGGNTGSRILVGSSIAIPSQWINNPLKGMAVGVISTTLGTAPNFSATWDFMSVVLEGSGGINGLVEPESLNSVAESPEDRFDVNGDGTVSPLDALIVINTLSHLSSAQGEGPVIVSSNRSM